MEIEETNHFIESLRRYGPSSGRVLDIGCGTGYLMQRLKEMGYDAVGIDAHPEAVKQAKDAGFEVLEGRFEEGMYPDENFDLIIARSILEHTVEPVTLLSTMKNALKPGGVLAIEVPNAGRIIRRNTFGGFGFHHVCYWSVPTLRYAMTLQGLDLVGGHEENYIAMFGRKAEKGEDEMEPVPPGDEYVEMAQEELEQFFDRKERLSEALPELIDKQFADGVVILGAGTPTVDLLYYTGLDSTILKVVTSDKSRHGSVLAGTRFTVEPLEDFDVKQVGAVLVSSDRRREELIERLGTYQNKGGRVIRFAPEIEVI
jgi:SAM-dependent methyltransferase